MAEQLIGWKTQSVEPVANFPQFWAYTLPKDAVYSLPSIRLLDEFNESGDSTSAKLGRSKRLGPP
jgi:hypothetical protein